jgi:hypothetical protein
MGEALTLERVTTGDQLQLPTAAIAEVAGLEELWQLPTVEEPQATAAPAEQAEDWVSQEEYAHSLRLLEMLGAAALEGSLASGEGIRLKEIAKDEWKSCLVEMLNTDEEFRNRLQVTRERAYAVQDGKVVCSDAKGNTTPIVDLIGRGTKRAEQAAEEDPRMRFQAQRDKHDLSNAQEVDRLEPGTMRIAILMDPKAAFRKYGKAFVGRLGYREGWGSIQGFWKTPDGKEAAAFTYTFNDSNMDVMRQICHENGVSIPPDVTEDTFINHAITLKCDTMEQARAAVIGIRDKSYQKQGIYSKRYSVDEFLEINKDLVDQVFDTQYTELATAHKRKLKNETVHIFAESLLLSPQGLGSNALAQLRDIYGKQSLSDQDTRLMDYLLRYGLVERLRPALGSLGTDRLAKVHMLVAPSHLTPQQFIARSLAGNMLDGIRAGRTYGGCARGLDLIDSSSGDKKDDADRDPLDAFGGWDNEGSDDDKSSKKNWKLKWDVCGVNTCPSRGSNPKRPLRVLCGPCGVCMARCQRVYNTSKSDELAAVKLGIKP